jgi:hypothetical protein
MRADVNDLVKHNDDGSLWLSRVTHIDGNRFLTVIDEYIIKNNKSHVLSDTGISESDVLENYGNISLENWFEIYPEYRV